MQELSESQKARSSIRKFKTLSDALMLRGFYKPSGKTGERMVEVLKQISPEIYGTMSDPRVVELKGLEYVFDRMPRGIEKSTKLILTAQEDFQGTAFEEIIPLKRRRVSYAMSEKEFCFVITRGASEIYDILTHITFLVIESQKIFEQICSKDGIIRPEWIQLEEDVANLDELDGKRLDKAIWNLSIILGRTYKETKESYESFQKNHEDSNSNNGLFKIIHAIGSRKISELKGEGEDLTIHFTPSLQERIGHHQYASTWATNIKELILNHGLQDRPIHIISANLHSVKNIFYCAAAMRAEGIGVSDNLYEMVTDNREREGDVDEYASSHGYHYLEDSSGSNINTQIIDTAKLDLRSFHPSTIFDRNIIQDEKPVIIVMDYAFGAQAFELMDELLCPCTIKEVNMSLQVKSISIMGKAGILPGNKGDIMLANAHVMEGTANNYRVDNDLCQSDFEDEVPCFTGPMVTVLGTSLQNRAVLRRFHESNWSAVGLEMEGGHYQRAISAAIIQGHIPESVKIRYAYYASDNPMKSGQTLASGPMGQDGIVPTYKISQIILQKIMS